MDLIKEAVEMLEELFRVCATRGEFSPGTCDNEVECIGYEDIDCPKCGEVFEWESRSSGECGSELPVPGVPRDSSNWCPMCDRDVIGHVGHDLNCRISEWILKVQKMRGNTYSHVGVDVGENID